MEMQRGPRGLRDREYPEDVQGHAGSVDEGTESTEPAEQQSEDEDDVQGHLARFQTFGEERDGRER